MSKQWAKWWGYNWFTGELRQSMPLEERGVLLDMFSLATFTRRDGYIERFPNGWYSRESVADFMTIPTDMLNSAIDICVSDGAVVVEDDRPRFANWKKYQPDKKELTQEEREAREKAALSRLIKKHPEYAERCLSGDGSKDGKVVNLGERLVEELVDATD